MLRGRGAGLDATREAGKLIEGALRYLLRLLSRIRIVTRMAVRTTTTSSSSVEKTVNSANRISTHVYRTFRTKFLPLFFALRAGLYTARVALQQTSARNDRAGPLS